MLGSSNDQPSPRAGCRPRLHRLPSGACSFGGPDLYSVAPPVPSSACRYVVRSWQGRSVESIRPNRPEQSRSEQSRSEQVRSGQVRAGQGKGSGR